MIRRRPAKGLLAGLYELPNELGTLTRDQAVSFARENGFQPLHVEGLSPATHIFTHVEWHMTVHTVRAEGDELPDDWIWVSRKELDTVYAVPNAFDCCNPLLERDLPHF